MHNPDILLWFISRKTTESRKMIYFFVAPFAILVAPTHTTKPIKCELCTQDTSKYRHKPDAPKEK